MTRILASALLALVVLASCRKAEKPSATPRYPKAPVVLISIDTLRADRLPAYGYTGGTTPSLDRFRGDAILYENAYSHCPLTLPSHVSMLTGLLPTENGVRNNLGFTFQRRDRATLPTLLEQHEYATAAMVSSFVLRGETGLATIFETYDDSVAPSPDAPSASRCATARRPRGWRRTGSTATANRRSFSCCTSTSLTLPGTRRRRFAVEDMTPTTTRSPTPTRSSETCSTTSGRSASTTARSSSSSPITAKGSATTARSSTGSSSIAKCCTSPCS